MTYPTFEEVWSQMQAKKAMEMAAKYASVNEAFKAFETPDNIQLLAGVIHPGQRVLRWEKSGSPTWKDTDGLPYSAEAEGYSTVAHGYLYYFHVSTLKEGDTVEWDNSKWQVLMNHFSLGSAYSPSYQCLYLLEVQ